MKKPKQKTLVTIGDKMAVASSEVVRLEEIKYGPVVQPPLSAETRKLIKEQIMEPLAEVYPISLEKWEDGFRRDMNPDKEIAIMLVIAKSYSEFLTANALDSQQKKETFGLALARTSCPDPESFWKDRQIKFLSRKQAETITALVEKNWQENAWRLNQEKRLSQN